jgi:hypothetical protein
MAEIYCCDICLLSLVATCCHRVIDIPFDWSYSYIGNRCGTWRGT